MSTLPSAQNGAEVIQATMSSEQPEVVPFDTTGQVAPPGMKPRVTCTLWEDEGTICFQIEARCVCVARREDNHFINGTKLLNVTGMMRGRRDGILKSEKLRHVVKIGPVHLKGVWIPFERALDLANKEKITDLLYPLFVHNIGGLLYNPIGASQVSAIDEANEKGRMAGQQYLNSTSDSTTTLVPANAILPGVLPTSAISDLYEIARESEMQGSYEHQYHSKFPNVGLSGVSNSPGVEAVENPPELRYGPNIPATSEKNNSTTGSSSCFEAPLAECSEEEEDSFLTQLITSSTSDSLQTCIRSRHVPCDKCRSECAAQILEPDATHEVSSTALQSGKDEDVPLMRVQDDYVVVSQPAGLTKHISQCLNSK